MLAKCKIFETGTENLICIYKKEKHLPNLSEHRCEGTNKTAKCKIFVTVS